MECIDNDYFEVGSKTSGLNRKRAKRTVFHGSPYRDTFLASTRLGMISLDSSSEGPCSDAGTSVSLTKVPHGCPAFGVV